MNRILSLLFIAAIFMLPFSGCANRQMQTVEQSLLLEENRRLYDALYVAHAQLEDLQHENKELRESAPVNSGNSAVSPLQNEDDEDIEPYTPPEIILPPGIQTPEGGSQAPPAFFDNGAYLDDGNRHGKTIQASAVVPVDEELRFPEILPEFPTEEAEGMPIWSPMR